MQRRRKPARSDPPGLFAHLHNIEHLGLFQPLLLSLYPLSTLSPHRRQSPARSFRLRTHPTCSLRRRDAAATKPTAPPTAPRSPQRDASPSPAAAPPLPHPRVPSYLEAPPPTNRTLRTTSARDTADAHRVSAGQTDACGPRGGCVRGICPAARDCSASAASARAAAAASAALAATRAEGEGGGTSARAPAPFRRRSRCTNRPLRPK